MNKRGEIIEKEITSKTIQTASIDGFGVYLTFTDGTELEFDASDGGYSSFTIKNNETISKDYPCYLDYPLRKE